MFGLGARFGTLLLAGAILFAALRFHKSAGKHVKITKAVGVILAFLSGCAFLITFVGSWMSTVAGWAGTVGVSGLIVCAVIILVDWLFDKKPDKPAFWAAFALAFFIVFGVSQIPTATGQVKQGTTRVGDQLSNVGK